MKKLLMTLIVTLALSLGISSMSYASETEPLDGSVDHSVEFITPSPTVNPELIMPLDTFKGSGGVSALNWGATGHILNWRVKPDTYLPYVFAGKLKIYKNDVFYKSYDLTGIGAAGIGVSDTIELWKLAKGRYEFELSGVAMNGKLKIFVVSSDASITINVK